MVESKKDASAGIGIDRWLQPQSVELRSDDRYVFGERRVDHSMKWGATLGLADRVEQVLDADGDQLSEDELISIAMLILVAGYETTVNLVGNGLVALMNDRKQFEALCADPGLSASATDELLRFDSPAQMTVRIAMDDIEIGSKTIKKQDSIIMFIGAANQDAEVFDRARSLDIKRSPNPHLAFGAGIHHCLGAALARTEAIAAFAGLARHFPNITLVSANRRPTFTLRGFDSVVVSPNL